MNVSLGLIYAQNSLIVSILMVITIVNVGLDGPEMVLFVKT